MKRNLHATIVVALMLILSSCAKDNNELKASANIYTVNAAIGAGSIKVNPGITKGFAYKNAPDLAYGTSSVFGTFSGSKNITVVSSTDTTKTLFSRTIDLQSIHSLYIAGQSPTIDTIFRTERNFPYIQGAKLNPDSSIYIRFINLSPNSTPLKIKISTATTNEVDALAYKDISPFKKYSAQKNVTANYVFEVRDVATNTLRTTATATINPATNRYKTISIIYKDLMRTAPTGPDITFLQLNYN